MWGILDKKEMVSGQGFDNDVWERVKNELSISHNLVLTHWNLVPTV